MADPRHASSPATLAITAVTTNLIHEYRAVTAALQFCVHDRQPCQVCMTLFLRGGDLFPKPQSIHVYTHRDTLAVSLC